VRLREMIELRPERRVIAAPTVNEQQLRIAAASPLVVQRQTIEFRVRQYAAILSRQAQRHQPRVPERVGMSLECGRCLGLGQTHGTRKARCSMCALFR
jgi:hypothetical protein